MRSLALKSVFVVLVLAVCAAGPAFGQKFLNGTISTDTTLDTVGGSVYQVTSSVTVNAGVTLTIDPGVTVKFDSGRYMNVYGTLFAEGGSSPDSMIVFTSLKDDDAPLVGGEDTNGDGAATSPARGDWNYIQFLDATSSGSSLRWCLIRFGGYSSYGMVYTSTGSAPTFRACELTDAHQGFYIRTSSAPVIRNTAVNRITTKPIQVEISTDPVFENIIMDQPSGNGVDAITLINGAVAGSDTITRPSATLGGTPVPSLAYEVTANIDIAAGETLDIEAGVVLKFIPGRVINNYGLLTALGGATPDSVVYFTSIDDDNAPAPLGQDTNVNGNATFPDQSDWYGIRFYDSSDDASVLRHCRILFAGQGGGSYGAVTCYDASPKLVSCDLTSGYYGIYCTGVSEPLLSDTSINAMQDVPIAMGINSDPVFDNVAFESTSDNGFDAIGILGGTLTGSNTLRIRGAQLGATPIANLVYILLADITVAAAGDLTIDPGVVAKPRSNVDLFIDGQLFLDGTADPDSQIVFTSYKDDSYGTPNDTNNDGAITAPAKGDWGSIQFRAGSGGSVSYATLRFGSYTTVPQLNCTSASPDIHDVLISDVHYGIGQAGDSGSAITDVQIANTTYTPILMSLPADPVFTNVNFTNVGLQAIGLIGETVGIDAVLKVRSLSGFDNISYYLAGNMTVAVGSHLRIEPGIVIKMATGGYGYDWHIEGSMQAVGTPDSLIAFTGIYDDSRGNPGDTAGDGANSPDHSQWGYVRFAPTSDDPNCNVRYCDFAYGGYGYSSEGDGAIWCNSASPTIRDTNFITNYIGVWTDGDSAPLIQDCYFFNQNVVPLATSVQANPTYVGNVFDQNSIHAVGLISETLTANSVLEKIIYPYYNLGTTTVGTGVALVIQPGVLVKARAGSDPFVVNGSMTAAGIPADRIVFTSIKDDSQGGDSNVDGSATSPAAGDWGGIVFNPSAIDAACLVEECLFRFGGQSYAIDMDSCSPTVRTNEFELCHYGLRIRNDAAPVIQDNLFRVLTWYPIEKSILSAPTFSGNVMDNVNYRCIAIRGESIGQDMTMQKWDFGGFTNITQALVAGNLTVQLGATLTIEPGIVLKMLYQTYSPFAQNIYVYGALVADGTAVDPIIFTSMRDDSAGNPADTNSDGSASTPAISNWTRIYYDEVSDDLTNIMDHCELRYGYNYVGNSGMVHCNSASPTFSNCLFQNAGHAISAVGVSNPVIATCDFDGMVSTPILMSLTSDPVFSGNHFLSGNGYHALGLIGETLAQDATIRARDVAQTGRIPYLLLGNLTAGYSSILRIEPGVVIKSSSTSYTITIRRGLIAEGGASPDSLIVFTSATDDLYGGDTNNDGTATAPSSTRWGRIIIQNEAIDDSTRIRNAIFRYGYNSSSYGMLEINSADPEIDDCVFAYNGVAIDYKGTAGDPSDGWIHGSDFYGNTYYAVRNQGTAFTVDATGNWWGHATGPLDSSDDTGSGGFYNPGGLGDPVSDRVDYGSWLTDGIQNLLFGDVSRNGDIRAYDGSLVLQELVGPGLLGPLQIVLGDVNCSGGLSALDASLILRYVAGLDSYFPCSLEEVPTKNLGPEPWILSAEPVTFTVGLPDVRMAAGESAWVPVQIDGSGDLLGQEYHIKFDPAQVSVTGVRLLPAAAGSFMAWNVLNGNELRIALASLEPMNVVDSVEFELTAATGLTDPQDIDLVVSYARLNEEEFNGPSGAGQTPDAKATVLDQNHPNPFNPSTEIRYFLSDRNGNAPVRLEVFDLRGRLVRVLVDEPQAPGEHRATWDGKDDAGRGLGSGIYLYRLHTGDERLVRKMMLLK